MTPDPTPIPATGASSDIVADLTSEWECYCEYDDCVHSRAVAEIKRLQALVDDYENSICWDTTCTNCAKLLDDNYDQYCEIERLRAERDDHKARLAVEAVTAPDADYDAMVDSLQARIRDIWANTERMRALIFEFADAFGELNPDAPASKDPAAAGRRRNKAMNALIEEALREQRTDRSLR